MSTEQSSKEPRRSTIVSRSPGLAYQRMREARPSHFTQSLVRKLTAEGVLLAALATLLAQRLVVGGGATGGSTPDVVALAAGGAVLLALTAGAHAAVGVYRIRNEPLTERQALRVLAVEDAASYLGIGTGGLVVVTTGVFAAVGGPLPTAGTTTTAVVAAVATTAAVLSLAAGAYVRGRLPRSSRRNR